MILKYTGPKPSKTVTFHNTIRGIIDYVFDPACEVNPEIDQELIDFCLASDRQGLFVVWNGARPAASQENANSQETSEIEEEKPRRRGRPRKVE